MTSRAGIVVVTVLAVLPLAVGLLLLPSMPEQVPTHWGMSGQPDAFGSACWFVLILGSVNLAVGVLCQGISFIGSVRANADVYWRIATAAMSGCAALTIVPMLKGAGWNISVVPVTFAITGFMLAAIGGWMRNVRRNPWVGIRTPWTLSNDEVWERTHQGAKVMVVWGLAIAITGVALPIWTAVLVIVGARCGCRFGRWSIPTACIANSAAELRWHGV
jgi:uncharacterized membrane protein